MVMTVTEGYHLLKAGWLCPKTVYCGTEHLLLGTGILLSHSTLQNIKTERLMSLPNMDEFLVGKHFLSLIRIL